MPSRFGYSHFFLFGTVDYTPYKLSKIGQKAGKLLYLHKLLSSIWSNIHYSQSSNLLSIFIEQYNGNKEQINPLALSARGIRILTELFQLRIELYSFKRLNWMAKDYLSLLLAQSNGKYLLKRLTFRSGSQGPYKIKLKIKGRFIGPRKKERKVKTLGLPMKLKNKLPLNIFNSSKFLITTKGIRHFKMNLLINI